METGNVEREGLNVLCAAGVRIRDESYETEVFVCGLEGESNSP